jgi:hypothetical protein
MIGAVRVGRDRQDGCVGVALATEAMGRADWGGPAAVPGATVHARQGTYCRSCGGAARALDRHAIGGRDEGCRRVVSAGHTSEPTCRCTIAEFSISMLVETSWSGCRGI